METWSKKEGMHLIHLCLANPSCIKAAQLFTLPINLRLSPRSLLPGTWCCQVTAEPSLCVVLFQDLQQPNLPLISSFSLLLSLSPRFFFLLVLHGFHEHVHWDFPLWACAEGLSKTRNLMKCAIHSRPVDCVLWVGRFGSRWRAWTDIGWRPSPLLHEWY